MVWALGLVLVAAVAALVWFQPGGKESPQAVVTSYLQAASGNDLAAIERLVPSDYDARDAISASLQRHAGTHASDYTVIYEPNESSPSAVAAIVRAPNGSEERLALQRRGQRWYLLLGQMRPDSAPSAQASRAP